MNTAIHYNVFLIIYIMEWYDVYDGAFFLSLATMVFAFAGVSVRYCFRSKCKTCTMCCIRVERDIKEELSEDLILGYERKSAEC